MQPLFERLGEIVTHRAAPVDYVAHPRFTKPNLLCHPPQLTPFALHPLLEKINTVHRSTPFSARLENYKPLYKGKSRGIGATGRQRADRFFSWRATSFASGTLEVRRLALRKNKNGQAGEVVHGHPETVSDHWPVRVTAAVP
jgi:hypothetical protein